ncbi:hypothetical protein BaRGS_00007601, partial [Batillaria attramentaria]
GSGTARQTYSRGFRRSPGQVPSFPPPTVNTSVVDEKGLGRLVGHGELRVKSMTGEVRGANP